MKYLNIDIFNDSGLRFSAPKIARIAGIPGHRFLKIDGEGVDVASFVFLVAVVWLENVIAEQTLKNFVRVPVRIWRRFVLMTAHSFIFEMAYVALCFVGLIYLPFC